MQAHPIVIRAVYRNGVIKPMEPVPLPDNEHIQVLILPGLATSKTRRKGSLYGAFPELAAITEHDLAWAERLWEHGVEKQSRILDNLE